ncbi:hypothetical protein IW140_004684 [Coemansia sp. RSA 1813]|nr:hypothetical protein LPJ74_004479 [Coemansia sp. RSA 1843]KAJ2567042.1 hypothetical protein IW140_004684 [Coemansia sp. RSA 1813]
MSHIYTHTGERPFACDFPECTKRFSVLSNLRRHYRVHSNCRQRNGKKRCRGRPPAVSNQLVGHNHLGPSYFGNSNSNTMQSLDNFISTSQFLVGNTLPNSITDGVGRSRGIYYQPFNANHSTASSELLQTPLNSQALFTTKGQDYMQCSYAPSFRATAAIHPPNASLASMCNPSTNPECILGASMEAGGCVPPASQMPFTERPILYNSKPILLSAQNDFRQNGTTSPNSKYCKSLLSSLSTSPDNIVHGGASHSNDTTGGSYKADITAAQLEALFNSTSAGPGCTSNKISSISSISSRSSTSSNDGGCNDLLSASMWPFSAEGAGVTSKGMDSLETLTTVASNATNDFLTNDSCKRQQFPPGIAEDCDALSIARPAIATNNFVTTKAMNAGIHVLPESNMLDSDRTNNLFSFPQQKHGPHESNLSQFTNQQLSSTRTDKHNPTVAHIGAIGGMVLDHYVQNPMANVQDGFSDPLLRNLTKQQDSHHKYTSRGAPW